MTAAWSGASAVSVYAAGTYGPVWAEDTADSPGRRAPVLAGSFSVLVVERAA